MLKEFFARKVPLLLGGVAMAGCQGPQEFSTFLAPSTPELLREVEWVPLASDGEGDGRRANSADGRSFLLHYDDVTDTVWFRLELHRPLEDGYPALSVAVDTDADQASGISWYGANADFTFERMVSVGPREEVGDSLRGYNGVTDSTGVSTGDWINVQSGVVTFYVDPSGDGFVLGIAREDIAPGLRRFNVIGSVGSDARWNDDIGESGFAAVDLDVAGWMVER